MYILIISTHKFCLQKKEKKKKLKGFWPDSSEKFTYSFAICNNLDPLPLFLNHTQSHAHTDAGKACRRKHALIHTHTHTHTHTTLSVNSASLNMACGVGEILVPLCQQEIQMIVQILRESESQSCWVCLKRRCYANLALVQCDVARVHGSCASLELRIT